MTAVTTAGLLAGLFGSAFVPAANATRAASTVSPKASLTVLAPEADLDDATAGGTAVGFLSADSDIADAGIAVAMKVSIASVGGTAIEVADLKATSSNDDIQVAWLYLDNGDNADDCTDVEAEFSDEDAVTSVDDVATGVYWLCLAAAEDDTAAVSTVTIHAQASGKAATEGYVLLKTLTVTAIGPVDSIALSITDGYKYVAEENDDLDAWLTIKCYDERDVLINDKTASISEANSCGTVTEDSANAKSRNDLAIAFITTGTVAADAATANAGALQLWDLDEDTCNTVTGDTDLTDEGASYSLKVAIGTVKSNAITITCTDVSATAIVTKVTGEAASGDQVYDDGSAGDNEFEFVGTVTDANGRPLGDGAAAVDFVWTIDGGTEAIDTWVDAGGVVAVGGEVRLGELDNIDGAGAANPDFGRLGRHTMTLSAADSDLGATTNVAKDFEVVYNAVGADDTEISSTRNAAKTRAVITADMTEDNAFERIEFFVELSNGTVKSYVRRANAEGVATLVQVRRRTTVYVYADVEDGGGSTTDVMKVVFK